MRVNARLDDEFAVKIDFLRKVTGLGVSDCIKKGVALLYNQVRNRQANSARILEKTGFIGCGRGPTDLSKNYKKELFKIIGKK